jgi:hypothetical protein
VPPPQSTPVSFPFTTASVHVGALQVPPVHTPLWQSDLSTHPLPSTQVGQPPPPQSWSVSIPSATPSVHVAIRHFDPTQ